MADLSLDEILEGANSTLRQQFVRRGKVYSNVGSHTFSGTSNEEKLIIRNISTSGVNAFIFEISVFIDVAATTSQLNQLSVFIFRNPTITSVGTLQTTRNQKSGASDTSHISIYKDPTISAASIIVSGGTGINAIATTNDLELEPGDDLLIRMSVNDSNNDAFVRLVWAEDAV